MAEASTRELVDTCVHCGFCLPACPTYSLWGDESDSPRGRIHLMSLLDSGELEWGPSAARHFDRCLGCMACVPACPSGVRYDLLIERTRAERRSKAPRGAWGGLLDAAIFATVPRPRLLRADRPGRSPSASAPSRLPRACGRPTCAPAPSGRLRRPASGG